MDDTAVWVVESLMKRDFSDERTYHIGSKNGSSLLCGWSYVLLGTHINQNTYHNDCKGDTSLLCE